MKPKANTHKTGTWLKPAILTACTFALTVLATACGSKNSGSPPPATIPMPMAGYYGAPTGCGTCMPNGMTFLTNAVGNYGASYGGAPVIEMGLDFYGDPSRMGGYGGGYPQPYSTMNTTYYGPVMASGYLALGVSLNDCGIPAGMYTLQTGQPGVFGADGAGRSFDNIVLAAAGGPMPIQLLVSGFTAPSAPPARSVQGRVYQNRLTATTLALKRMDTAATCNLSLYVQ